MCKIKIQSVIQIGAVFFLLFNGTIKSAENADSSNCTLWGTGTEITTYQQPYCPVNAPEIPLRETKKEDSDIVKNREFPDPFPTSPETAIAVIDSKGNRYCYYYTKMIRYRLQGDPPVYVPVWTLVRVIMPYCPPKELTPGAILPAEPSPSGASLQFRTLVSP